jgi:hypothetical protein
MWIHGRTTTTLTLAVLVAACQRTAQHPPADTGRSLRTVVESPGALATRRETQDALERARLAFERKDARLATFELKDAAAFIRTEAEEVGSEARAALRYAADELDTLVTRIAKGDVRSAAPFVTASLTVNRAEAAFHLQWATDALAKADNARAADELTMTVDHLERAAKDAGRETDPVIDSAIADARTLAGELAKGVAAVPDERMRVTEGLANAITRFDAFVKVTKEP